MKSVVYLLNYGRALIMSGRHDVWTKAEILYPSESQTFYSFWLGAAGDHDNS